MNNSDTTKSYSSIICPEKKIVALDLNWIVLHETWLLLCVQNHFLMCMSKTII